MIPVELSSFTQMLDDKGKPRIPSGFRCRIYISPTATGAKTHILPFYCGGFHRLTQMPPGMLTF